MFLELIDISYTYLPGSPLAQKALEEINLKVESGEFVALIGPTGSGKSTLLQIIGGLLHPLKGQVLLDGVDLWGGNDGHLRQKKIGLVFQEPEKQLFGQTVFEDVAFGPRNLGFSKEEISRVVKEALEIVDLDFEAFQSRYPFALSGGEMRRIAIAGVLAMQPELLVLDEPTSGLDYKGRKEIVSYLQKVHQQEGVSIILITHDMDEVAELVQRVILLNKGKIVLEGHPQKVFAQAKLLQDIGLGIPQVAELAIKLKERDFPVERLPLTLKEAEEVILQGLRRQRGVKL